MNNTNTDTVQPESSLLKIEELRTAENVKDISRINSRAEKDSSPGSERQLSGVNDEVMR